MTPGGCLPLPRDYIHVLNHYFQTSSSLKPLGQSMPNHVEPFWEGRMKVYVNGPGHRTKMAASSIYGKNLQKSKGLYRMNNTVNEKNGLRGLSAPVLGLYTCI